jgi:hypothetical protein
VATCAPFFRTGHIAEDQNNIRQMRALTLVGASGHAALTLARRAALQPADLRNSSGP